eukprot:CAMPEP_0198253012 /NCGR_PEP_ID=MMETSP1447-20131203/3483_1 /TAXON_ID=420782 /ORGANISM="Chaetoceros dichaeta, Strain CCMP1751" /LENGTH=299 /DNA_ID=CAMNT_0043938487 /DNA_START=103 /DNA_END=999 /DNA_ORIENTATION=-
MKCTTAIIVVAFLTLIDFPSSSARPTNLQEQKQADWKSVLKGVYVGFETLVALMGYDQDEEVNAYMNEGGDLTIGAMENEEDQTTIQIVGLGLGRTGSTSLAIALEILKYTVIHDDEHTEITDLLDANEEDDIDDDYMHEILGLRGYNATFKTAGYNYVAEHPEIKAILSIRDTPDKYVDSWLLAAPFMTILEKRPFCWMSTVQSLIPSFEAEFKHETTNGKPEDYLDRQTLRANYVSYNRAVQEAVPADRLLIFNAKQGWEPLCEFLGVSVPEGITFPHVHTRAKLLGEMWFLELITW